MRNTLRRWPLVDAAGCSIKGGRWRHLQMYALHGLRGASWVVGIQVGYAVIHYQRYPRSPWSHEIGNRVIARRPHETEPMLLATPPDR